MNISFFIIELAKYTLSLVVGYFIGNYLSGRSQKIQILREYIIGIVKAEYPSLFADLNLRLERFDNFLEKPYELTYKFPKLKEIYEKGWIGFMKKHHNDLFLSIDYFQQNLLPKFEEIALLSGNLRNSTWKHWGAYLEGQLPEDAKRAGKEIADDLIRTINPYNVFPDLLNGRYEEAKNKIKKCFVDRTSRYIIKPDLYEISHSLIESAKFEVEKILKFYRDLKEQNDRVVKGELLSLLQKYINNPV